MRENDPFDVIVAGAGNAALCAAISAKEQGAARVLVLEKAGAVFGRLAGASAARHAMR